MYKCMWEAKPPFIMIIIIIIFFFLVAFDRGYRQANACLVMHFYIWQSQSFWAVVEQIPEQTIQCANQPDQEVCRQSGRTIAFDPHFNECIIHEE